MGGEEEVFSKGKVHPSIQTAFLAVWKKFSLANLMQDEHLWRALQVCLPVTVQPRILNNKLQDTCKLAGEFKVQTQRFT